VFLVGSQVDIPSIKPRLEAATALSVTTPEEPEMALARGASLAAANAQLGAPRTVAMPLAQDPSFGAGALAYSAEADTQTGSPAPAAGPQSATNSGRWRNRKSVLTIACVVALFIGAAVALALAARIGPHADQRPDTGKTVVAPPNQPPPPNAGPTGQPPPSAVPGPDTGAPPQAPPPPSSQVPPHSGDHQHWDDWLHRHLGQGGPLP
jgi:hypothetical protein